MDAIVRGWSRHRELYAAELEAGDFIVFAHLAGMEPERGDRLTGIEDRGGGQTVTNVTRRRSARVVIEWLHAPRAVAIQALRPRKSPAPEDQR